MNVIVTAFLTAARAFCSVLFWGLDSWKNRIQYMAYVQLRLNFIYPQSLKLNQIAIAHVPFGLGDDLDVN